MNSRDRIRQYNEIGLTVPEAMRLKRLIPAMPFFNKNIMPRFSCLAEVYKGLVSKGFATGNDGVSLKLTTRGLNAVWAVVAADNIRKEIRSQKGFRDYKKLTNSCSIAFSESYLNLM